MSTLSRLHRYAACVYKSVGDLSAGRIRGRQVRVLTNEVDRLFMWNGLSRS